MPELIEGISVIDWGNLLKIVGVPIVPLVIKITLSKFWGDLRPETPKKFGISMNSSDLAGLGKWQDLVTKVLNGQKSIGGDCAELENAQKRIALYLSWVDKVTSLPLRSNNAYKKLINIDIWWICNPRISEKPGIKRGYLPVFGQLLSLVIIITWGLFSVFTFLMIPQKDVLLTSVYFAIVFLYAILLYAIPIYMMNEAKDSFDCCCASAIALHYSPLLISDINPTVHDGASFLRGGIYEKKLRKIILRNATSFKIFIFPIWAATITAPILRHIFKKQIMSRSTKIYEIGSYIDLSPWSNGALSHA